MLKLKNITKDYVLKEMPTVHALKGITINFRRSEFVAILGQSGCGKTTLLNIIGGLDRYTNGDLIIEGKSTKKYTDRDWDTYRNHSIGFVFQSYNLIGHINVLANVELALTISGVGKTERRQRALNALKTVGLEGMEKKRPNQLSGGQMQRVAIARALVNNPEILLADEPTGALDSETSLQIMDLLKKVSKSRLVIMVTHNPELAEKYATRIVNAKDGLIISDSNPFKGESTKELAKARKAKKKELEKNKKKLSSMSFKTAFGLSLNNMMTKKGRTFLTAFAGSIGIIGIALILSVSFGFDGYIGQVQEDALTSYPMSVTKTSLDTSTAFASLIGSITSTGEPTKDGYVGMDDTISNLVTKLVNSVNQNNTKGFKKYLEQDSVMSKYTPYLSGISYTYTTAFNTYTHFEGKEIKQAYPADLEVTDNSCIKDLPQMYQSFMSSAFEVVADTLEDYFSNDLFPTFSEMIPNIDPETKDSQEYSEILNNQYDVVYGKLPKKSNEVVIVLDQNNNIPDFLLYSLGLRNPQNLVIEVSKGLATSYNIPSEVVEKVTLLPEEYEFPMSYENICKCKYYLPLSYQLYKPDAANTSTSETLRYYKKSQQEVVDYLKASSSNPADEEYVLNLDIVGIVRTKQGITSASLQGAIGYLPSLTSDYLVERAGNPPAGGYYSHVENNVIMGQIKLKDKWDVLKGKPFKVNVTDNKTGLEGKIFPYDEEVIKTLDLPEAVKSIISQCKGYAFTTYTNLTPGSLKIKTNSYTYEDRSVTIPVIPGITEEPVTLDGLFIEGTNNLVGFVLPEQGAVLLAPKVSLLIYGFPEDIPATGLGCTYDFEYTYETNNSAAGTYAGNCSKLGITNLEDPASINFFPKDFESKKYVDQLVNEFNAEREAYVRTHIEEFTEEENPSEATIKRIVQQNQVSVSDTVGLLMGSVQTIVDSVSYVLIAFVSISLIVSSIMIAIITYVSVLERTKEIGILRSLGARKSDIANVFNAETVIIGLTAGLMGILAAFLLDIPITIIITSLAKITLTVVVPWYGAIILPCISVLLTVVSGFVPSIIASKKDPVIALRSE